MAELKESESSPRWLTLFKETVAVLAVFGAFLLGIIFVIGTSYLQGYYKAIGIPLSSMPMNTTVTTVIGSLYLFTILIMLGVIVLAVLLLLPLATMVAQALLNRAGPWLRRSKRLRGALDTAPAPAASRLETITALLLVVVLLLYALFHVFSFGVRLAAAAGAEQGAAAVRQPTSMVTFAFVEPMELMAPIAATGGVTLTTTYLGYLLTQTGDRIFAFDILDCDTGKPHTVLAVKETEVRHVRFSAAAPPPCTAAPSVLPPVPLPVTPTP